MSTEFDQYLSPTKFIDSAAPELKAFAESKTAGLSSPREKAVALYYAVRDGIHYDPYSFDGTMDSLIASKVIAKGRGFCVPKAIALAAVCRAAGVPARLGFADVRNHLTTEKLRARMGGRDEFIYHGYTVMYLDGAWVKATPTFNLTLCEKFRVKPLEWDGKSDALYHAFDLEGRKHMEYVRYHGEFADLPFEKMMNAWKDYYGSGITGGYSGGDFAAEAKPL